MKVFYLIMQQLTKIQKKILKSIFTAECKLVCRQYKNPLKVNGKTQFNRSTYLGQNTNFNGLKIEGAGRVQIGDNFHSGSECLFITQFHNYKNGSKLPYDEQILLKEIQIDDNVWIGSRVTVLGGVKIGEGAVIQAGSVVVSDIAPLAVAGGSPAKVFKFRNEKHYFELKAKKAFF